MNAIVVHYKELALKGRNRPWFIQRLTRHLRLVLADLDVTAVRPVMGRIEIELGAKASWDEARRRVARVFGIANFSYAGRSSHNLDEIAGAILHDLDVASPESFRVTARRADKTFAMTSPQIEREVGGRIKAARGWTVDLDDPALTIHIDVLPDGVFYYFGKEAGAGGLPAGSSGRVACLMSGGIDSPVAAYRMMRRGCSVMLVHFHSYPVLSRVSQDKVLEIARLLAERQLRMRVMLVPFGDLQQQMLLAVAPPLRVVLYRRMMLRIAERLARAWRARALVTGEAVGQVASQTIENIATIDAAATMAVLRPLVGTDKDEIVAEAERIGTFPISIIPDQDCCQLFTPRHPSTAVSLAQAVEAEQALPVADMVAQAAAAAEVQTFTYPVLKLPVAPGAEDHQS